MGDSNIQAMAWGHKNGHGKNMHVLYKVGIHVSDTPLNPLVLKLEYWGKNCWYPGSLCHQVIQSHDIDYAG